MGGTAFLMSIGLGISAAALYSLRLFLGAFLWTSRILDLISDMFFSILTGVGFLVCCLTGDGFRIWWLMGAAGGAYLWYSLFGKRISTYAIKRRFKKKRKKHLTLSR